MRSTSMMTARRQFLCRGVPWHLVWVMILWLLSPLEAVKREERAGTHSHPTLSSEPKWSVIFGIAVPRMELSFKTSQYERSHFIK
ncbi:hypothetical protein M432DRAFT_616858 [Thermoascus aurantiacus ATCC 26904]